jgi:hypothetical protein
MAEHTHRLLPSRSGVSSLVQADEKQYFGRAKYINSSCASSETLGNDLSSWPVCRHYPACEICEQCAKHNLYQKRVSSISRYIWIVNRGALCRKYSIITSLTAWKRWLPEKIEKRRRLERKTLASRSLLYVVTTETNRDCLRIHVVYSITRMFFPSSAFLNSVSFHLSSHFFFVTFLRQL